MRAAVIVFITHKGCVDCDEWCSGWDFKILAGLLGCLKIILKVSILFLNYL